MRVTDRNRETWHTVIAVALFVTGASAAWYAMVWVPPYGEISGSVLGFVGETFTPAGGLLGIVNYTRYQIDRQNRRIDRLARRMEGDEEDPLGPPAQGEDGAAKDGRDGDAEGGQERPRQER